jgi:hypothetical protein
MGSLIETLVNWRYGGFFGLALWSLVAVLPPLVVMAMIGRQVAPRTLAPMARRLVWLACLSGLVLVWVKTGVPATMAGLAR